MLGDAAHAFYPATRRSSLLALSRIQTSAVAFPITERQRPPEVQFPHAHRSSVLPRRGRRPDTPARAKDILEQKTAAPFPELKGHRVRLATLHVFLEGNRPIGVAKASYNFITFDEHGLIECTEWDQAFADTVATWTIPTIPKPSGLIDARALHGSPSTARNDVESNRRHARRTYRKSYRHLHLSLHVHL